MPRLSVTLLDNLVETDLRKIFKGDLLTLAICLWFVAHPVVADSDWSLTNHQGEVFQSSELEGDYVFLYFGYLTCADFCPMELNTISKAMELLEDLPVAGVFVSVDPERDSPEDIGQYVSYFHPKIVGLTGTEDEVRAVARRYKVKFSKRPTGDTYFIDHSIHIVVIDPAGVIQALTPYGVTPQHLAWLVMRLAEKVKKPLIPSVIPTGE